MVSLVKLCLRLWLLCFSIVMLRFGRWLSSVGSLVSSMLVTPRYVRWSMKALTACVVLLVKLSLCRRVCP